jgi:hypothetical protein
MEVEKIKASEAVEDTIREYFIQNPYNAQRVDGFSGPHALTVSRSGASAVMRSRPMVQLFDASGALVDEVPLPILRQKRVAGRHGKASATVNDYKAVVTSPIYEKAPWAHEALQVMAAEYDRLEAMGLGELYAHFHGAPHRLAIIEKGADVLQLVGNKLIDNMIAYNMYNDQRGNTDAGFMSTQALASGGFEHFLTLNAKMYASSGMPILGHELAHRIDMAEPELSFCYSGNAVFEKAVTQDIGSIKGSQEIMQRCIIFPLFDAGDFCDSRETAHQHSAREVFATLFEEWLADPHKMQREFPNVHAYIEQYVLPDLRLRHKTGSDRSYLAEVLESDEGQRILKGSYQTQPDQQGAIEAISDVRYDVAQRRGLGLEDQALLYVSRAEDYVANTLPETTVPASVSANKLRDGAEIFQQKMLKLSGETEMPSPYGQGPRYTGR